MLNSKRAEGRKLMASLRLIFVEGVKSPTLNEGVAEVKGNALLLLNWEPNAAFVVWAVFAN